MAELRGIYPILATPFRSDGKLDETSFERLIEFLATSGVQGVTLFGLAGEYYKLSDDERSTLQRILLKRTNRQLVRIVSITDHSLELARQRALEATNAGADALMVLPPFFLSPDTDAIRDHIAEIAHAVRIPIIVQYAPNQTGLRLPTEFFVSLAAEFSHLRYVKVDSTPVGPLVSNLFDESGGRILPFVGYAGLQMVDAFGRGAVGCMPGCSVPEPYLGIYRALAQNEANEAVMQHVRLLPLINFMMQSLEFIVQCEKTILYWRGIIDSDYCRRPGVILRSCDLQSLKEHLESSAPKVWKECCTTR
jgi:dihydrodipicolinate synthase/N-acetylneuraminate lyase